MGKLFECLFISLVNLQSFCRQVILVPLTITHYEFPFLYVVYKMNRIWPKGSGTPTSKPLHCFVQIWKSYHDWSCQYLSGWKRKPGVVERSHSVVCWTIPLSPNLATSFHVLSVRFTHKFNTRQVMIRNQLNSKYNTESCNTSHQWWIYNLNSRPFVKWRTSLAPLFLFKLQKKERVF